MPTTKKNIPKRYEFLSFVEKIPKEYREGPWHPLSYVFFLGFAWYLGYIHNNAMDSYAIDTSLISSLISPSFLTFIRGFISIYCFCLLSTMIYFTGPWLLESYTITSWNLLTLRCGAMCIADLNLLGEVGSEYALFIARCVKFPALAGCTVTVVVWWSILTPLISKLLDKKKREGFWKFNLSFPLVNFHC